MTWTPALAIAGGLLALGPIIIHIIFRRRYTIVHFAAMRFIMDSLRRSKQRLRLEELLMILLRVLICLLIGFMLADIRADTPLAAAQGPTAHIIVLDDSLSMRQQFGSRTLFDAARDGAADLFEQLKDDDLVAILSAARPRDRALLNTLTRVGDLRQQQFDGRIRAAQPTDLASQLPDAVARAAELLTASDDMPGHLHVFSDFRRTDLAAADAWRTASDAIDAERCRLTLHDYGAVCKTNLAVDHVAFTRPVVVAGIPAPVQVTVRNTGTDMIDRVDVVASVGDAALPAVTLEAIAPGQTATADFVCTFAEPGDAFVSVALPADGLLADNIAHIAVQVRDAVKLLIVDGSANPADRRSASFALAHALDPSGDGAFAQQVDVVQAELWAADDLHAYDAVMLTNVTGLPVARDSEGQTIYPHVQRLEQYVRDGGGLAVFLSPDVDPAFYNGPMHRDGAGLLPVRVEHPARPVSIPAESEVAVTRLAVDSLEDHPLLAVFADRMRPLAGLIRINNHVAMRLPPTPPAAAEQLGATSVLATLDVPDRSPWLVQRTMGSGVVAVWAMVPDADASDWPKQLSFLPAMNDLLWTIARRDPQPNDVAGTPVVRPLLAARGQPTTIELQTPRYPEQDIQLLSADNGHVRYSDADAAGLYQITLSFADRTQQAMLVGRQVAPRESLLDKATESDVAAVIDRPHTYRSDMLSDDAADEKHLDRTPVWLWLMLILLAVLAVEGMLAQRFGHHDRRGGHAGRSLA